MNKNTLSIGIIVLFIISSISPMVFGYSIDISQDIESQSIGPMNSAWSMKCHDNRHTSQSSFNTSNTTSLEKWRFVCDWVEESAVIDNDGVLYFGSWDYYIHALYPNGTEKWKYQTGDIITSAPAIAEDGTIYIGSWDTKLYAFNPDGSLKWKTVGTGGSISSSPVIGDDGTVYIGNLENKIVAIYNNGTIKWKYNTEYKISSDPAIGEDGTIYIGSGDTYLYAMNPDGTLKWRYKTGDEIHSHPSIWSDGTIYFGSNDNKIYALYPNGTLRWKYKTGHVVYSSPAIGDDGTVYCGSHDTYLYALYPNNGTLKWKYKTGDWIRTAPCIGDDGTIYVVSLDGYLYAINPNGTMKWKTNVGAGTSPTIGQDGTIYAGYSNLYAINPTNGSVKWKFKVSGGIGGGTPCNSIDGAIYFGTTNDGQIISINSDGTERWREKIGKYIDSPPAISENGTVYVGSSQAPGEGFLHAFGELDPDAPSSSTITGKTTGTNGTLYEYRFKSTSPVGRNLYYYITWGDGSKKDWFGPFNSGEEVTVSHSWYYQGTYTIKARAKDTENLWGLWGELQVKMPRDKSISISPLLRFLERYILLNRLLNIFVK